MKQDPSSIPSYECTALNMSLAGSTRDDEEFGSNNKEDDAHETSDDEGIEHEFKHLVEARLKNSGKRYNPLREPVPKFPAYHPSFNRAKELAETLIGDMMDLLKSSNYQDVSVVALLEQLAEHQKITFPDAKRIGIVGGSGIGKSSLINALLDSPGLAPSV